jgi:sugar lactone lactonase YvrE
VDSSITNRRTVVKVPEHLGLPDGMTLAVDGTLWVAHWGPGLVCQWCPKTGSLLSAIETGCPHTTSCCFGGTDGRSLFITTSRLVQLSGGNVSGGRSVEVIEDLPPLHDIEVTLQLPVKSASLASA